MHGVVIGNQKNNLSKKKYLENSPGILISSNVDDY
jgi:hypothetical protein